MVFPLQLPTASAPFTEADNENPINVFNGFVPGVPHKLKADALQQEMCALDTLSSRIPKVKSLANEILVSEKQARGDDVAESVNRARQENRSRSNKNSETGASSSRDGTFLKGDSADVLRAQIIEIEKIRNEKSKVFEKVKDIASPDLKEDERLSLKLSLLKGLIMLIQNRIDIKYSYLRLFAVLTFFCIYSATVILQRDITDSFGVQSR
jgi:hypothetical protein